MKLFSLFVLWEIVAAVLIDVSIYIDLYRDSVRKLM